MKLTRFRRLGAAASAAGLIVLLAGAADAHVLKNFGSYSVALGWKNEPTYVGSINAVQAIVKDKDGKAVTDLADGALKVVVSVGGQSSQALSLNSAFDEDTGLGIPGDYEAPLTPTAPGDYSFHLTGAIHGQAVDETATSSDATFDSAVEANQVEFPAKVPSLTEITTRLDRIDQRLAAASSAAPAPDLSSVVSAAQAGVGSAQAAASQARDAASTALAAGVVVGAIGIVLGGAALVLSLRARRPG
jgi:hypothetical protein